MRRLTHKQRTFNIRKMRRTTRRKAKHRRRIREQIRRFAEWRRIEVPVIWDLNEPKYRSKLLVFLEKLRVSIIIDRNPVCLDLSGVKKLVAGATLLFVAELRRLVKLVPEVKIRCFPPKKRKMAQVFYKIEVFKILRHRTKYKCFLDTDVIHWRFAMGYNVEGEKFEDILGAYDGRIADKLTSNLYVGITEAMKNAHNHAHILPRQDGLNIEVEDDVKNWWMFSQENYGYLSVVFCDLGAGIPKTLPKIHPTSWEEILIRLASIGTKKPSDAEIIQEATKLKVSRTGQSHRGRGLNQIVNTVTKKFHGDLIIYSNAGVYQALAGSEEYIYNYETSIMGTLIAWRIPLPNSVENYYGASHHQYRN